MQSATTLDVHQSPRLDCSNDSFFALQLVVCVEDEAKRRGTQRKNRSRSIFSNLHLWFVGRSSA